MSRSIHKTIKGVFGGKSVREVNEMISRNDHEIEELGKKYRYKSEARNQRNEEKAAKKSLETGD